MMYWAALALAAIFAISTVAAQNSTAANGNKAVVAHFMIGVISSYTAEDWIVDIKAAQEAGIDAFALNCANEPQTVKQIPLAYQTAQQLGFKVFLSFDMNSYWGFENTDAQIDTRPIITEMLNTYSDSPAQFLYNGKAIISGFSGDSFPWQSVLDAYTGKTPLSLMPNYHQTSTIQSNTIIDGALSWFPWPTDGNNGPAKVPMDTTHDTEYQTALGPNRVYIAPVSPWFFTHLQTSADFGATGKNWLFVSEDLLYTRWEALLKLPTQPGIIEIVTWNDYGESHYMGPVNRKYPGDDDGSGTYAGVDMPHDALRSLSAIYIKAFKAGLQTPKVDQDQLVFWHRPSPKDAVASGDPLGRPNGADMVDDVIFIATAVTQDSVLEVVSGSSAVQTFPVKAGVSMSKAIMGIGKQSLKLTRGGQTILSGDSAKDVTATPRLNNFNVFSGMLSAAASLDASNTANASSSAISSALTVPPPLTSHSSAIPVTNGLSLAATKSNQSTDARSSDSQGDFSSGSTSGTCISVFWVSVVFVLELL